MVPSFRTLAPEPETVSRGGDVIQSLTELSQIFIFSYSPLHRSLLSWSDNAQAVLGVKDMSIARDGNLFLRHVHPDDRFLLMTDLENALKGKESYRATYRWIRPDTNELRWLHCRATLVTQNDEPVFEGVIVDLTQELSGNVARIAGADSVATVLAAFPTFILTLDRDLRLLRINRSSADDVFTFGDQNFHRDRFRIGRPLLECFSEKDQRTHYRLVMLSILEGKSPHYRARVTGGETVYNIEILPLIQHDTIEGLLITVADVTEVVRLERKLAELQRTEGLRLLAAGVSHNFNNALQGIMGQAAAMLAHSDKPELIREASQSIIDIIKRTSELTRELSVDDAASTVLNPIDLNLAAMAAVNRIDDLFTSGFQVSVVFGSPPNVLARHDTVVKIIEELLRNAKESMHEGGGLSLKTYQMTLSDFEVDHLKAGTYAKLAITDSGGGMSEETLKRCLDPFFTTKNRDTSTGLGLKGEGLGLSKALNVAREFGGALVVESMQGVGTTIALYLPAESGAGSRSSDIVVPMPEDRNPPEILVVDDDVLVLNTVSAILRESGHRCVCAEDWNRAVTLVKAHGKHLRVALVDAIMPGVDGSTVLRRLKRLKQDLTVIGFTGAAPELSQELLDAGASRILRKPVDPTTLRAVIDQALKERAAA